MKLFAQTDTEISVSLSLLLTDLLCAGITLYCMSFMMFLPICFIQFLIIKNMVQIIPTIVILSLIIVRYDKHTVRDV